MRRGITDAQRKDEKRYSQEEIKPTPETVSSTSSTNAMSSEVGDNRGSGAGKDADMAAGLKHDVVGDISTVNYRIISYHQTKKN